MLRHKWSVFFFFLPFPAFPLQAVCPCSEPLRICRHSRVTRTHARTSQSERQERHSRVAAGQRTAAVAASSHSRPPCGSSGLGRCAGSRRVQPVASQPTALQAIRSRQPAQQLTCARLHLLAAAWTESPPLFARPLRCSPRAAAARPPPHPSPVASLLCHCRWARISRTSIWS